MSWKKSSSPFSEQSSTLALSGIYMTQRKAHLNTGLWLGRPHSCLRLLCHWNAWENYTKYIILLIAKNRIECKNIFFTIFQLILERLAQVVKNICNGPNPLWCRRTINDIFSRNREFRSEYLKNVSTLMQYSWAKQARIPCSTRTVARRWQASTS